MATDGGSTYSLGFKSWFHLQRGGYGIAVGDLPEPNSYGAKLPGLDQGPFAAEAYALLVALHALQEAGVDAHIIIDNRAVLDGFLRCTTNGYCPAYGFEVWRRVLQLCTGRNHSAEWVPAHDAHTEWSPRWPEFGNADTFSRLNDAADKAASAAAERHAKEIVEDALAFKEAAAFASRCLEAQAIGVQEYDTLISARLHSIGESTWKKSWRPIADSNDAS